jgi:hypothetical protein
MNTTSDTDLDQTDPFKNLIRSYSSIYDEAFTFCIPHNWLAAIQRLTVQINTLLANHPAYSIEVSDVKEKWGCLRFYYTLQGPERDNQKLDQKIEALIEQADLDIQSTVATQDHPQ